MTITKFTPTQYEIIKELSKVIDKLLPDIRLQAAINSWGDTLPDEDVLGLLKEWNEANF